MLVERVEGVALHERRLTRRRLALGAPTRRAMACPMRPAPITPVAPWRDQLTSALMSLGWTAREAEGAVAQLAPVADEQVAATGAVEIAVLLRQALRLLGRT